MEYNKGFKKATATIQALEQLLYRYAEAAEECEQSAIEAQKKIEDYFAKCISALISRKVVMLGELSRDLQGAKTAAAYKRIQLEESIAACKRTFAGATELSLAGHTIAAECICQDIACVSIPRVYAPTIKVEFKDTFYRQIHTHGSIQILESSAKDASLSRFVVAERVSTDFGLNQNSFASPLGMCLGPFDQCLYVCDAYTNSIKRVTMDGQMSTLSSSNILDYPCAIVMNHKKNIFYVVNSGSAGHSIAKVSFQDQTVDHFTGSYGYQDGGLKVAKFKNPSAIAIDQESETLYVCEYGNNIVRKITPKGEVTTLAGSLVSGYKDGKGITKFDTPMGMFFDHMSQTLLVCDTGNNKLRRVTNNGEVSTVCHVPQPVSVTVTMNHIILVVSSTNRIFRIRHNGKSYEAVVLAGSGKKTREDGKPSKCGFIYPSGIAVHEPSHSCFISDGSNAIRRLSFVSPN